MAKAMIDGILSSGLFRPDDIFTTAKTTETCQALKDTYGIHAEPSNALGAAFGEVIILAVKPTVLPLVAPELLPFLREDSLLLSLAAGTTLATLEEYFGTGRRILRAMPNTPAQVGEAMTGLCGNASATEADFALAKAIFSSFGKCQVVSEDLMNAVTGVSGSSPAYVYLLIDAMAKEAEKSGMSRQQALVFAAQATLGAAKMVLETETDPLALKDAVCSPGGTTIEAVAVLEEQGFSELVQRAQAACVQKAALLSQKK